MAAANQSRPGRSTIAYLGDPMPTRGPGPLLEQLRAVKAVAGGRSLDRTVVDSGSALTASGRGANLDALIREGVRPAGAAVVIVAGRAPLGVGAAAAVLSVAELLLAGFAVEDPSGAIHPVGATASVAAASARRSAAPHARKAARHV